MLRRLALPLALAALASACVDSGAGSDDIAAAIREEREAGRTGRIEAPPVPDAARTGRVGVLLRPNSTAWRRAIGAPRGAGSVVLLVFPGSPAAEARLRHGDVILSVDGQPVPNEERARALLRARAGQVLRLEVARRQGPALVEVRAGTTPAPDLAGLAEDAISDDPADPRGYYIRAQAAGSAPQRLDDLNRALELAPDLIDALVARARVFWEEALAVEDTAIARADRTRALNDYERAIVVDPTAAQIFVSRGKGLIEIGDVDGGIGDLRRAIDLDPVLPSARALLALAELLKGEEETALEEARRAVSLDPFEPESYRALARAFLAANRRADAQRTVDAGLTIADTEEEKTGLREVLGTAET